MAKPTLYVFAISHFCEKARWALDAANIDYKLKFIAPGAHMQLAKKLGLEASSVPILIVDGNPIQGSSEIIDWIDDQSSVETSEECREIENRLDDVLGIHIRRYYYSEAILDQPETVLPIFKQGVPFAQKLLVHSLWSKIRGLMVKGMDLGPEQRIHSRDIVKKELDWVDRLLADGGSYLTGDQFTRADITAASLLSPLALPPEHPSYAGLTLPPILAGEAAEWENRPFMSWVREMYKNHR